MDTLKLKPKFKWNKTDSLITHFEYLPYTTCTYSEHCKGITVNVKHAEGARKLHYGTIMFLNTTILKPELVDYITSNWDQNIPLNIWCEINGLTKVLPPSSWNEIQISGLTKVDGPLHYFDLRDKKKSTIRLRRKNGKPNIAPVLKREVRTPRSTTTSKNVQPISTSISLPTKSVEARVTDYLRRRAEKRAGKKGKRSNVQNTKT